MNEDTIAQKLNMRPLQDTQEMLDKLENPVTLKSVVKATG